MSPIAIRGKPFLCVLAGVLLLSGPARPAPARTSEEAQGDIFQADAMLISRQFPAAYDRYKALYAEFPDMDRVSDGFVRTLEPLHRWDEMLPIIARERDRRHSAVLFGKEKTSALRSKGLPAQALEEDLLWWVSRPTDAGAGAVADTILLECNYSDPALATLKSVARQAPQFLDLRKLYIRILAVSSRGPAALSEALALDKETNGQGRNAMDLAVGIAEAHPLEAVRAAEAVMREYPNSPAAAQARLARGRWAQGTPRWEEAARDLRDLASERPGTSLGVQAEMILAEGSISADPVAARAKAAELAARFPEAAGSSRRVIALSYLHEKNYPAAARTFGDEVRFEDKDPVARKSALWNRAECYFFGNVMDSANIGYKAVALQYLNDRLGHEALERMLLLADAADDGEEALKDFAVAASLAGQGSARADSLLQKVYAKYPRKVAGLEALFQSAEIHRKRGDMAEALRMYTVLSDTSLNASRAQDALFQAAELQRTRLSQPRRALELYSDLVTRYPDSWLAPEARRWVEALKKEVGS